jgi:hypothetical protein
VTFPDIDRPSSVEARTPFPRDSLSRPLSPLERWYWIADQVSPLNVIARVQVRGELSLPALRQGLQALQARQPLLRVAIEADANGANPRFIDAGDTSVPLRHAVVTPDEDRAAPWVAEVDGQELREAIDWRTGPLVRALVLTREPVGQDRQDVQDGTYDLVLTVAHCIADGTTALTLLQQWIELTAELRSAGPEPAAQHFASRPFLPAAEDLLPTRHRGWRGRARLARQGLRDRVVSRGRIPGRIAPDVRLPFAERRTGLVHRSLSGQRLDALVRACRREGVTVHGVLAAAMVTAVAREAGVPGPYSIGSPVDFRGELVPPVSPKEAGSYVATVGSVVLWRPGAPLWPTARAISEDIVRHKRRGDHFSLVNLIGAQGPASVALSAPFMEFMEAKGPINLCLSNLSTFDMPDTIGPWALSEAQFIAGISVTGYFVAAVNTTHGQLSWNFTYVRGALSEERARNLADDCVAIVEEATGQRLVPKRNGTVA